MGIIQKFLKKRRIRKTEQVLSGEDLFVLKESTIHFALVAVSEADTNLEKNLIGTTVSLAEQYHGVVMDIMPPLVSVVFERNVPEKNRTEFVADLQKRLKLNVRIIHGSQAGHIGTVGSDSRMAYSFILPGFAELIKKLLALPFGQNKEV